MLREEEINALGSTILTSFFFLDLPLNLAQYVSPSCLYNIFIHCLSSMPTPHSPLPGSLTCWVSAWRRSGATDSWWRRWKPGARRRIVLKTLNMNTNWRLSGNTSCQTLHLRWFSFSRFFPLISLFFVCFWLFHFFSFLSNDFVLWVFLSCCYW